jgi:heme oxygenase
MLQEASMVSSDGKLEGALSMLETTPDSKLKQIMALQQFEKSMNSMYLHRYEPCAQSFQKMVELNNWSHGLYYYIAACCYVERYRELASTEPEKAVSSNILFILYGPILTQSTGQAEETGK